MASRPLVAASLVALFSSTICAPADEVRYYEKNGVTWCETRRTVEQRVPVSHIEQRTETIYREEFTTEMRHTTRTYQAPVTEYRWEAFWVGRWNPLARPYLAYRYVPRTRWETRTEVVKVPVNIRRLVPQTRTIRRAVGGFQTVQREVVSRVPVGGSRVRVAGTYAAVPPPASHAAALAQQTQIGGISRMDGDPPRYGTATAWRASAATLR